MDNKINRSPFNWIEFFLIQAYGFILFIAAIFAFFISPFFKGLRKQRLASRFSSNNIIQNIPNTNEANNIFIFCSSAGEFEQGFALHETLINKGYHVVYFIQSMSGIKYIRAKKYQVDAFLAPIDLPWIWNKIFNHFVSNLFCRNFIKAFVVFKSTWFSSMLTTWAAANRF